MSSVQSKSPCSHPRNSSRSSTCTSFQLLKELPWQTSCWRPSSGDTWESKCTRGKLKCETWSGKTPPDCDHMFHGADGERSDVWRGGDSLPTNARGICRRSLENRSKSTEFSLRESREYQTFQVHGFCSSSAQRHGPIMCSEWSTLR